jgi:hypothetical protein
VKRARWRPSSEASSPEEQLEVAPGGAAADTPYPQFDVAGKDKWAFDWDAKTRKLVLDRVRNVPAYRFFSPYQVRILEALCALAMPQDERPEHERVPIAPWIDSRLYSGEGDGYRYEDMPDDREAYRQGLSGFDQSARTLYGQPFTALDRRQREEVMQLVSEGNAPGDVWQKLPPQRFFRQLMSDIISNYYAHPAAWAEMGFNGPASPRGHMRLGLGKRDPWEADEKRPRSSAEIVKRNTGKGQSEGGGATH